MRTDGQASSYIDSGIIRTATTTAHVERLRVIGGELRRAADAVAPDLICMERVFININPKSSLLLGEARGAALMALLTGSAPIIEMTALQIKQSVAGAGRANKKQVATMVGRLLNITVDGLAADCTDALACALAAGALPVGVGLAGIPLRRQRRHRSRRR